MDSWRVVSRLMAMVSLAACGAFAQSQSVWSFPDFSARQAFQRGAEEISFRVYRLGSRVRLETNSKLVTLYDPVANHVYSLTTYPNGRQGCIAMTLAQAQMLPSPLELLFGDQVKRTPAGSAMVEGHECDVEDVEVARADGKTIKSRVWQAKDLKGIPVKIESQLAEGQLTAFYRDIVVGPPDAALLTPPGNCVPVEKMGVVEEEKPAK